MVGLVGFLGGDMECGREPVVEDALWPVGVGTCGRVHDER